MTDFKFGLNTLLTTRATRQMMLPGSNWLTEVPTILTVTEQIARTCSAGTQLSYRCKMTHYHGGIYKDPVEFQEGELTADLSPVKPIEPEKKGDDES